MKFKEIINKYVPEGVLHFLSSFTATGRCKECGISWTFREHMDGIHYDEASGAFPLCQRCFDRLDADKITQHFIHMYLYDWERSTNEEHFKTFEYNVRKIKNQE